MDKNLITSQKTLVTVMMPVRNGERYLGKAIESVLSQTFTNYELLILEDNSTDRTVEIIRSYQDKRIRLMRNKKPLNLAEARQKGVEESRGKYIAFLDADDMMLPQRLETQIRFLNSNLEIAVVGSWVEIIDENGKPKGLIWKHTTSPEVIPSILLFRNCFTQSSVTLRKDCLLDISYQSEYWPAPDFDLWTRLVRKYKMANIPQVLTYYRIHQENSSIQKQKEIKECTQLIFSNSLRELGFVPTDKEIKVHDSLERNHEEFSKESIDQVENWLIKLIFVNHQSHFYLEKIFNQVISDYWFKICCVSARLGFKIFKKYYFSPLSREENSNWKKDLIIFILATFRKSQQIDVTSQTWIKITQ